VNRSKLRLSLLLASLILLSTTLGVAPVKASPSSNNVNPQSETGTWELVYYEDLGWKDTVVGYVYSAPYLSVDFSIKFKSKIEWKYSIDAGALQVGGTHSYGISSEISKTFQNGASATIYYLYYYRYYYYEWTGTPPPEFKEEWHAIDFDPYSGTFKPPAKETIGSAYRGTLRLQPGQTTKITYEEVGGSWLSIGAAVTLTGTWEEFQGSVTLGGSFYMYFEDSTEVVYVYKNLDNVYHEWILYGEAWVLRPVLKE